MRFFTPKEIKWDVEQWIHARQHSLFGRVVVDIPAGNGVTSAALQKAGALVQAYDLFPEFFRVEGVLCLPADLSEKLPIESESADYIFCQEGIEHICDQAKVFAEFSRVLKPGGRLILTTPNYSGLKAKVSYLFGETEVLARVMPPNEIESLWFSDEKKERVYFGHVFLVGLLKLRLLALLANLRLGTLYPTRANSTSLLLFPILYPFIYFYSWRAYRRSVRKAPDELSRERLKEVFRWSVSPHVLCQRHLFLEFVKEKGTLLPQRGSDVASSFST